MSKKRSVKYSLYEIVIDNSAYYNFKTEKPIEHIFEWFTPQEFAGLKRTKKWKNKISCKKLSTVKIDLSF